MFRERNRQIEREREREIEREGGERDRKVYIEKEIKGEKDSEEDEACTERETDR